MNLQDQVLFRCIHSACARPLARRVNFCPYCGTPQREGLHAPDAHAPIVPPPPVRAPEPAPVVVPIAATVPDPVEVVVPVKVVEPVAPVTAPVFAQVIPKEAPAEVKAASEATAPVKPPPPAAAAPARAATTPPRREPIRMRYWIMALVALWLVWLYAKPGSRRLEPRVEQAIALSGECKVGEAQAALATLRTDKATAEQVRRVQTAISKDRPGCEKAQARARAWDDVNAAVSKAIDADEPARAHARLNQFTKKYGEDDDTRALKARIGPVPQRESRAAPEAAPAPVVPTSPDSASPAPRTVTPSGALARKVLSVRNLISEAERDIAIGNYQAASRRMESCMAMIEGGSRECAAFKVYADRLQADLQRCLNNGREWVGERCL